jgi:Fic family protein
MVWAATSVPSGGAVTVDVLLTMHERLLAETRLSSHAGKIRTQQNWIGGSDYNPCSADFVPPPDDMVSGLLDDLCSFCNDDSLPAVAQAAIAHAQFETIHPFIDGNGRIGRALIHLILRRRSLTSRIFAPVSLILATWSRDYVHALTRTRYIGPPDSQDAHDGLNGWMALFAAACKRAVEDAFEFEDRMSKLEERWRAQLGRARKDSAADLLLRELTSVPLITVASAKRLIGRSFEATNNAISRLVTAEVLTPVTVAQRNRAFEAKDVLRMLTDLERRMASPAGDTRVKPPQRRVPRRSP